jgi:hypothetical protein
MPDTICRASGFRITEGRDAGGCRLDAELVSFASNL